MNPRRTYGRDHWRVHRIAVAEGEPVGDERERECTRVAGGFGGSDQAVRGCDRLVTATGDRQTKDMVSRVNLSVPVRLRDLGCRR